MPEFTSGLTSVVMVSYHTGPVLFEAIASALVSRGSDRARLN